MKSKPVKVKAAAKALAAAIATSRLRIGGNACRVCDLPDDIRAVVDTTLRLPRNERRVSLIQLAGLLKEQGYPVGESSLQKHGARHTSR